LVDKALRRRGDVSRNQWMLVTALGLLLAVQLGCLGAALVVGATPQSLQRLMALRSRVAVPPASLVTFGNCLLAIMVLGLGGGLLLWRTRAERVKARWTTSYVPVYTCPICLAGPLIQTNRPRALGLRTTKHIICRACGSTLDPASDGYRYTGISADYPDMKRYIGKVFHSWHDLRNLAWAHPKRRLRANREAVRWERQKAEMSGERQELVRKRDAGLQQAIEDVLEPPVGTPEGLTLSSNVEVATEADVPVTEPRTLKDFIGQQEVKDKVSIAIAAAKARGEALGHTLLRGPEGSGKRTLALVIAREMAARITVTSGPALQQAGDLAAIITNLGHGDILFIDEVHRLSRAVEEHLCAAMENFALDILIGKGPSSKTIHLPLPQFTVLGATDQPDRVSHRLRELFEHVCDFEPYEVRPLASLVQRRAKVRGVKIDAEAALQIARAAGGRLREARRLFDRVRDYAQVRANGAITTGVALDALATLGIEPTQQVVASGPQAADGQVAEGAKLTWQDFEDFVAELFRTLGYQNVTVTSRAGDEGKDVVMEFESPLGRTLRVYVECKQWEEVPVGRQEVQILHSAVVADGADQGIVVTTGRFTNEAFAYAKKAGNIRLIDGRELRELTARAGLETRTESPLGEVTKSVHEGQLEPADGELGKETVTGIGPARPPVASDEGPPKLTRDFETFIAVFENMSAWARQKIRGLDDVHETEPLPSRQRPLASVTREQYRRQYSTATLQLLRTFGQTLDEAQQCLDDGLGRTVNQWGLTRRTDTKRLARQQQELADFFTTYQALFEEAFDTYLSLREVAPHPSLSDCHRDALEGMYYGLVWVLGQFVKYPAKEYEGRRVYITAEAPLDFVRRQKEKYVELTRSAQRRLASVAQGTARR
jgi:Holliday junction DNA helicase RuvB subunit